MGYLASLWRLRDCLPHSCKPIESQRLLTTLLQQFLSRGHSHHIMEGSKFISRLGTAGGGGHTPRCHVLSCDRGQDFERRKMALTAWPHWIFALDPWLWIICACAKDWPRLFVANSSLLAIVPQHTAWLFDQTPESALTVWLHLDPGRSSGHGAYGSDPPPPPPPL